MNLRDLRLRARALFSPGRAERDLHDELSFHVERETRKLVAAGTPAVEARARALASFGPIPLAADQCRDARGTAVVDDAVRDVLYALRTFRRAPLVALTIVSTVALGLGLVTVAFTILNAVLFRADVVPDVRQMIAVKRTGAGGLARPFTLEQFEALRRDTGVFADAWAEVPDVESRVEGSTVFGTFVTGSFFQVLRVGAARGRVLGPDDDRPGAEQAVMVLSHRGWNRMFALDPGVLGRRLRVNGVTFEIVGVMPEDFRGLTVAPDDYWAPLSTLAAVRPARPGRAAGTGLDIIGRLAPDMSRQAAQARLAVWEAGQAARGPAERGASTIAVVPRDGTAPSRLEVLSTVAPLFFAFGLILLTGCANVANLLLARSVARQREIGIRLSLGASRRRIVRQLLTESLLLALAAAAGGYAISRVALNVIIGAVMSSIATDLGDIRLWVPDADWRDAVFLIAGAGLSTLVFALAPALHATRIEPIRTMRGEVVRDARPGRARHLLIGVQVSASALLLIAAAVFLRSAAAGARFDSGMRTSDTLVVQIANEASRGAIVQAVTADPLVAAVAASWPEAPEAGFAHASGTRTAVAYKFVSPEYFSVLDIAIAHGRAFTPSERTASHAVAVVSESAARLLWPNAEAIGQVLRLEPRPASGAQDREEPALESRTLTVAGVVRDVPGLRILPFPAAVVYLPTNAAVPRTSLVARVHGDPEIARQKLLDRLTTIDPDMTRQVATLRTFARVDTALLQMAFWLTVVLGALALALTLSGLFSVLSYLVEQRTREIGVRMALGATAQDVTRLVLLQSIRPVGLGLLIGTGAAASLAALLLATPAAAPIAEIVHILDPVAYAGSLLVIIAACLVAAAVPASRAAHLDPTGALRQE